MKIDLHLHSKHSKRPSQWFLQKIGCPESFSEPEYLRREAYAKGMTGFTLTDHNTIDGCLELAHHPEVFISEEITTYFPEDGCKAHVLVWDIDRAIHEDIQHVRENIYDLAAYLRQQNLAHALAHPLFSINNKLRPAHFEKLLLMFKTFEMNGARDEDSNQMLDRILDSLTPAVIDQLADKHDMAPAFERPWEKARVGGSDDHSALNLTRIHTQVAGAKTPAEFLAGLKRGESRPQGSGSGPRTMAHNIYGIAYQFYDHKLDIRRYTGYNVLISLIDCLLSPQPREGSRIINKLKGFWGRHRPGENGRAAKNVLRWECERLIMDDPGLKTLASGRAAVGRDKGADWFDFTRRVSDKILDRCAGDIEQRFFQANPFSLLPSLSAVGTVYFMLAPFFVAYNLYGRDRHLTAEIAGRFLPGEKPCRRPKIALFTDSLTDENALPETIRRRLAEAGQSDQEVTLIACRERTPAWAGKVLLFEPVGVYRPADKPDQPLTVPPLLSMLDRVFEQEFTHIHALTPGPVGMAAATIARILSLPLYGTYQPQVHQTIARLAGDETIEQMVWRFFSWFYNQMDLVVAPSAESGRELKTKGVGPERIKVSPSDGFPGWIYPQDSDKPDRTWPNAA